jgi:hypothetical protein
MTVRRVPVPDQSLYNSVVIADVNYTAGSLDRTIVVIADGVTITLPPNPLPGEEHVVVADGFDVTVSGGAFPLSTGTFIVANGTSVRFVFGIEEWTIEQDPTSMTVLNQNVWHINPVTGSDSNSGLTATTALKTFAQWQTRVGIFTVLNPVGGLLQIFLDNDLPASDPITVQNFFAQGAGMIVQGKKKVLRTSTASSVQIKNRATNTPWAITDNSLASANGWTPFVGQMILVTSGPSTGSRAFVLKDLGAKQAQLSEWCTGDVTLGGLFPAPPPNPGDQFQILDFTNAYIGRIAAGFTEGQPFSSFASVFLSNLHFPMTGFQQSAGYAVGTNGLGVTTLADSIMDDFFMITAGSGGCNSANVLFKAPVNTDPGTLLSQNFGGYLTLPNFGPSGLTLENGATWINDGDVQFMGNSETFSDSTLVIRGGRVQSGPLGFWDTGEWLDMPAGNSRFVSSATSPFFGEENYVPLYGQTIFTAILDGTSTIQFVQQNFSSNTSPPLPALVTTLDPANVSLAEGQLPFAVGYPFNTNSGNFDGPQLLLWAKLTVNRPLGFLNTSQSFPIPGVQEQWSTATNPSNGCNVVRDAIFLL